MLRINGYKGAFKRAAQTVYRGMKNTLADAAHEFTLEAQIIETLDRIDHRIWDFWISGALVDKETEKKMAQDRDFAKHVVEEGTRLQESKIPEMYFFINFLKEVEKLSQQHDLSKLQDKAREIHQTWFVNAVMTHDMNRLIEARTNEEMAGNHPELYALCQELQDDFEMMEMAASIVPPHPVFP